MATHTVSLIIFHPATGLTAHLGARIPTSMLESISYWSEFWPKVNRGEPAAIKFGSAAQVIADIDAGLHNSLASANHIAKLRKVVAQVAGI